MILCTMENLEGFFPWLSLQTFLFRFPRDICRQSFIWRSVVAACRTIDKTLLKCTAHAYLIPLLHMPPNYTYQFLSLDPHKTRRSLAGGRGALQGVRKPCAFCSQRKDRRVPASGALNILCWKEWAISQMLWIYLIFSSLSNLPLLPATPTPPL